MKTRSVRNVIAVTLLCLVGTTACFGSFTTLRRVYSWNQTVDNDKWAKWGVFAAAMIVPVYPSATIFDLMFVNSVEFWSGRNPMAMGPDANETGEQLTMAPQPDGTIDATVRAPDGGEQRYTVVREPGAISAYDQNGELAARSSAP
jgi:Domain of unknown function (DUF3332)